MLANTLTVRNRRCFTTPNAQHQRRRISAVRCMLLLEGACAPRMSPSAPPAAVGSSAWLGVIARTLDACQLKLLSRRRSVANQPADRRPSSNRSFSTKTGSNGSGVGDALTR